MEVYSTKSKPKNLDEYIIWAAKNLDLDCSKVENYYLSGAKAMKEQFETSEFWQRLISIIKDKEELYLRETKYELLQGNFQPQVYIKPFKSLLDKFFRKNVVLNDNWPMPPEYGWIDHINCFTSIGDIIRTNFIVKYLDGIEWIKNGLIETCLEFGRNYKIEYEAREDGYYAVHYDLFSIFEIPKMDWRTEKITGRIEIQITTQLKDVIKKLMYKVYEEKRSLLIVNDNKWQWDYRSEKFAINYLGHILHYLEGAIMDIRNKK